MVDVVASATRSRMMSGIRGKNTTPEVVVRKALFAGGYRFRLHRRDLPGAPDVALPGRKVAIFVHGCFWHMHAGCKLSKLPSTRPDFWKTKLEGNVRRDRRAIEALQNNGWRVLLVWECATRNASTVGFLSEIIAKWVEGRAAFGEICRMPSESDENRLHRPRTRGVGAPRSSAAHSAGVASLRKS